MTSAHRAGPLGAGFAVLGLLVSAASGAQSPDPDVGVDLAGLDRAVLPGNDFFGYANGGWYRATQIPPDRSDIGIGAELVEKADEQTAALIRDAGRDAPPAGSDGARSPTTSRVSWTRRGSTRSGSRRSSRRCGASRPCATAAPSRATSARRCVPTSTS